MIKNIYVEIAYDGSKFNGWQRLPDKRTVQGYIEKTFSKLLNQNILIDGSGRTDKGVHALNQSFTFKYEEIIPINNLKVFLSNKISEDIKIKVIKEVDINFHARYSAVKKSYVYKINLNKENELFFKDYYYFSNDLNIEKMEIASKYLIGKNDFTSFSSIRDSKKEINNVREIYDINFFREDDILFIRFVGDGFLYKMIRRMVKHLIAIGKGEIEPKETEKILKSRDRKYTNQIATPSGLYLEKVYY